MDSSPTLKTCRTGLENRHRNKVNTTTTGHCSDARSIYTNLQPAKLSFTIESSFSINVTSDPKRNRITHWSFGIVENIVKVVKKSLAGKFVSYSQGNSSNTAILAIARETAILKIAVQ